MQESKRLADQAKRISHEYQEEAERMGQEYRHEFQNGIDAVVRSWAQFNKGLTTMAIEVTDYSKSAYSDATHAFQQVLGAKSVEQAFEVQSEYAKKAYDDHVAVLTKLGKIYVSLAESAFKPV